MTLLIQKPPTTNGYNTIATGDADPETTATIPHVTARRSTWTTTVAVAGMLMLSAGGGTVWRMRPEGGSSYDQSAGNIEVVAEPRTHCPVPPRTATFGGVSTTVSSWPVPHPFEVCWGRGDDPATNCWAESWYFAFDQTYKPCGPIPDGGPTWYPIETVDVVNGCNTPCQNLHHDDDDNEFIPNPHFIPNRTTPAAAAGLVPSSGNVPTAEVPGRRGGPRTYCTVPPRTATFSGTSITAHFWPVPHPFEVCYKRDDDDGTATYCWTGSQCSGDHGAYGCYGCYPKGGSTAAPWLPIDTAEVVNGCDKPCPELYGSSDE